MANKQIRVLLVEDNPGDVRLITEMLSAADAQKDGASFHLECAARLSTAMERVASGDIDVLLLDLGLPDSQGFDTYSRLHTKAPEVPIVVLTGLDDAALATRTVREGAQDYLAKSRLDSGLLRRSIRYAIQRKRAEKHIRHLNSVLRAIRDVNQLIVVEKDRTSLLQKSCDALVEARGYDAAWLAFSKDGESFDIVAGSGPGEKTSRIADHLVRGDLPYCVKTMLAHKEKLLIFDKPRECGECPFRSTYAGQTTVIIRVEHSGKLFGLLAISLGTDIAADDEEQRLLTEIASDLAIALRNMELEESRKLADQALRKSEKKFRDLAELLPQVVYETDARGNLTFTNRNGLEDFGYTQEDFTKGLNTLQMLVPEDHLRAREYFQRTLHGEEARGHEYTALRKDGSTFPVALYSCPIIHEGEPAGLRGIIVDISERKQAEVALRHESDKAQKYLDVAGVMLVALNSEAEITLLNARGCQILGCSEEEALGKNWFDLFIPERLRHDVRSVFAQLMAGQTEPVEYLENPVVARSGEERVIAWHNSILTDPAGNIVGILSSGEDITERMHAEEALRKSNETMSLLYEAGRRLSSTLDLDTLYGDVHDLISRVMDCDSLLVSSYNPEDKLIRCDRAWHAGKPFPVSQLPPIPLEPEGHGSQSVVIRTGQPLLIRDYPERLKQTKTAYFVNEKGRMTEQKDLVRNGTMPCSALLVPLKVEGQVVGVIKVASYAYDAYTEDDIRLLDSLAAQIALALRNATLYQQAQNEISNRIQAQEALQESEARYRLLAENAADVIWTLDMDLRFTYVSPSAARLSGCSGEETMAQTIEEMLTPDSTKVALKTYAEAVAAEAPGSQDAPRTFTQELEYVRNDGSIIWTEAVATILRDPDGRPVGILGVTRDIAERKQAEENLRESQERYRGVVETQAEMISRFLPDGTVTFANEAYCRNAGKPVEEVVGHTFWTRILEEDRQMLRQHHDSLSSGNPTTSYIRRFSSPDGEVRWQQWAVRAIFDQRDELVEYQSMGQDITERVRAEESLHRRDAILEAIGHAAARLLTETNWEHNIEEVLTRLGLATGVSRVSLFNNRLGDDGEILVSHLCAWDASDNIPPLDDLENTDFPLTASGFARWEEILGRGDLIHGHVRDLPPSERRILAPLGIESTAIVPVFVGQEWWGFIAFDDYHAERECSKAEIEALKTAASLLGATIQRGQAEGEKARLEVELRHSQKMEAIGSLAGGVAHDFNNILTVIQGYTEFVLMSIAEDDPVRRDLNEVRRASVRASNLTRQLLLFSRRQPMMMGPLDLNEIIRNLTKMLERLIGEDIALATTLEPNPLSIEGDAGTIEQIIMNLVVNSRDALPQGGEITIQTENLRVDEEYCQTCADARPGEFVCLSVTDTGTGIDPDIIDRIFEPFFTTKGPGKGTGMGLPVVYGIVKQHQGWIDVESSPGEGTTFRVYLPATSTLPTQEQESSVPTEVSRGKGERILLVEDEESIRSFAFRGLSEHGYVVYPAANVQEALDVFQDNDGDFDLIFNDLILPDGSGLKLAQRLLDLRPDTKVIFASGYSADKEDWRVIRKEGHPFLQKPYSLSDLLRVVREVLG